MKRQIRLNGLDMNCMGCTPGLWTHPRDESGSYCHLDYWTRLARVLERGLFDGIFIADILGVYDVYGGSAATAFRHAVEFPVNDPFLLVPAMAAVTEHLGFGVTGTISYDPPYSFARRVSTLDHLTKGRFAWNIVTGYLASAARAFGLKDQLTHDERYDKADEFMEVVYKLWEGSWEDDAVLRDKERGIFADADKIHQVSHKGRHYEMSGYHICEPSPQRTPVLFQAGSSPRGRDFAASHAECVFISCLNPESAARITAALRARALAKGRNPRELLVFTDFSAICGRTDAEAQEKLEDYRSRINLERTLTLFAGYTGVDFSTYDLDAPVKYFKSNAIQTSMERYTRHNPSKEWTLADIARYLGVGGAAPVEAGSPETLADVLTRWVEVGDVDGFNLIYNVSPGDFTDFVDLVIPELQRRGIFKTAYAPGTLREKLFGPGRARLDSTHPAAGYRSWAKPSGTAEVPG